MRVGLHVRSTHLQASGSPTVRTRCILTLRKIGTNEVGHSVKLSTQPNFEPAGPMQPMKNLYYYVRRTLLQLEGENLTRQPGLHGAARGVTKP